MSLDSGPVFLKIEDFLKMLEHKCLDTFPEPSRNDSTQESDKLASNGMGNLSEISVSVIL